MQGRPQAGLRGTPDGRPVPLLGQFRVFETTNLDESRRFTSRLWSPHAVTSWRPRAPFRTQVSHVAVGALGLSLVDQESWIELRQPPNEDWFVLCVVVAGQLTQWVATRDVSCEPGGLVAHSPTLETRIRSHGTAQLLSIRIEKGALQEELAAVLAEPLAAPLEFTGPVLTGSQARARLARVVQALAREVDAPDGDAWRTSLAARHYERVCWPLC